MAKISDCFRNCKRNRACRGNRLHAERNAEFSQIGKSNWRNHEDLMLDVAFYNLYKVSLILILAATRNRE